MAASAADPALDRAYGYAANSGRFLVGEPGSADEYQCLTLVIGQLAQGGLEISQVEMALLGRVGGQSAGIMPIGILNFAAALANLGIVMITQYGEEPGLQIGALDRKSVV